MRRGSNGSVVTDITPCCTSELNSREKEDWSWREESNPRPADYKPRVFMYNTGQQGSDSALYMG